MENLARRTVVQPWLEVCSLKEQTVLLCALRGCDGQPKDSPSKPFTRALRATILRNADLSTEFMSEQPSLEQIEAFAGDLDRYPMHWLMHYIHAVEIVGYRHPVAGISMWWNALYRRLAGALHLNVESKDQLTGRLK